MKKILLLIGVTMLSVAASAQNCFYYGAEAGASFSTSMIASTEASVKVKTTPKIGFYVGAFGGYYIGNGLSVETGLTYDYSGLKVKAGGDLVSTLAGANVNSDFVINYNTHSITLPIMAKYEIAPNFNIMVGPTVSVCVASGLSIDDATTTLLGIDDEDIDYSNDQIRDEMNIFTVGATAKLEYVIGSGISVRASYSRTLTSQYDYMFLTTHSNAYKIGVAYTF